MFVMPFGKHRGKRLDEVPARYLTWCLEEMTNLYPETREAIEAFLTPPDLLGSAPTAGAPHVRHGVTRRRPSTPAAAEGRATCAICGGIGTEERRLVHEKCRDDEVPF